MSSISDLSQSKNETDFDWIFMYGESIHTDQCCHASHPVNIFRDLTLTSATFIKLVRFIPKCKYLVVKIT